MIIEFHTIRTHHSQQDASIRKFCTERTVDLPSDKPLMKIHGVFTGDNIVNSCLLLALLHHRCTSNFFPESREVLGPQVIKTNNPNLCIKFL